MHNLSIRREAKPVNLFPPTNTARQNASPIEPEVPALNDPVPATTTRQVGNLNTSIETIAQEIYSAIKDNDLEKLKTYLENLGSATQETIFSVLSKQDKYGNNCLMKAVASRNLEILQLLLHLCEKLTTENLQVLLLQQDEDKFNFLMWAIVSKNPKILLLLLPLCEKLTTENRHALLLQQTEYKNNCLVLATNFNNPKILPFIVALYIRLRLGL